MPLIPKEPNSTRGKIAKIHRDIGVVQNAIKLGHEGLARWSRDLSRARKKLVTTQEGPRREALQKDIQRLEERINDRRTSMASSERLLADLNARLFKNQSVLANEQAKEHRRTLQQLSETSRVRQQEAIDSIPRSSSGMVVEYLDAFISHATEDKDEVAKPLAEQLRWLEVSVWYDDFELKVGDSLRRKIDEGLARSQFGIVVLSPAFFAKNWPQYELDGLVQKEMQGGRKVILPLWHRVSKDEIIRHSPSLADKVALSTSQFTIRELAWELYRAIRYVS